MFKYKKSYGIACCKINNKSNEVEILMVKKRNTYAYTQIITGNYNVDDLTVIQSMLSNMTAMEKIDIMVLSYSNIVRKFIANTNAVNTYWYKCGRIKFTKLTDNYDLLKQLVVQSTNINTSWELPRGRAKTREPPVECALREFGEETNILMDQIRLVQQTPIIEEIEVYPTKYIHEYYITTPHEDIAPQIKLNNAYQIKEISDIRWVPINSCNLLDITNCTKVTINAVNSAIVGQPILRV